MIWEMKCPNSVDQRRALYVLECRKRSASIGQPGKMSQWRWVPMFGSFNRSDLIAKSQEMEKYDHPSMQVEYSIVTYSRKLRKDVRTTLKMKEFLEDG